MCNESLLTINRTRFPKGLTHNFKRSTNNAVLQFSTYKSYNANGTRWISKDKTSVKKGLTLEVCSETN